MFAGREVARVVVHPGLPLAGGAGLRAHRAIADDLYGAIPISQWAHALLGFACFTRLNDVSLSDIPGALLFGSAFPSRLAHSAGVYHLARLARPRDRALQAAALAHDLGHGPFSHLTEPLMRERLGLDHEARSAALLRRYVTAARGRAARLLAWLDLDEVSRMITGEGDAGRGALLNGQLDYDNLDHVARFMRAGALGEPAYDGRALARGLRLDGRGGVRVALADELWEQARAWQTDRAIVFQFLQSDPWNGAAYGMIRKAIDLAAQAGDISDVFFDMTDDAALAFLGVLRVSQRLIEQVVSRTPYVTIWEADVGEEGDAVARQFAGWRERVALEERIAAESGLRASDVIATYLVSRVARPLPPLVSQIERFDPTSLTVAPHEIPERFVRLMAPAGVAGAYARRARMAAERALGPLGARPRGWAISR